jgi:hypothetical protein
MTEALREPLTRLRLSVFLDAEQPDEVLRAAYGKDAVLASATGQGGELHFFILHYQDHLYGLFLGADIGSDESWSSPTARASIAYDAVLQPHAGPATSVPDLIEGLIGNTHLDDWTEIWPSGHLLRALLALQPEAERVSLLGWIALGWPGVAQSLDAQERLVGVVRSA